MVDRRLYPVKRKPDKLAAIRRLKSSNRQDTEHSLVKRGPAPMPTVSKPSRNTVVPPRQPVSSNGVTPEQKRSTTTSTTSNAPAPTRADPNRPGYVVTRGTQKEFMADHPVLASKKGAARDTFLGNHPKINANVQEFDANTTEARREAALRRLKRVK